MTQSREVTIPLKNLNLVLDVHRMEDAESMFLNLQLYRGLFTYSNSGDVIPDLVDKWVEESGGRRYLFQLKNKHFSNGSKILAVHVVNSLARMFVLESGMSADLDYISGSSNFKKSKDLKVFGVKVGRNDREVVIELNRPSSLFLKQLAAVDCSILPINDFRQVDLPKDIFSGPFRLSDMTSDVIRMERWGGDDESVHNGINSIRFVLVTPRTLSSLEEVKALDGVDHYPVTPELRRLLDGKGWKSVVTAQTSEQFVLMNPKRVPKSLRRRLFIATDQSAMVSELGTANLSVAYGVIPDVLGGALLERHSPPWAALAASKGSPVSSTLIYANDSTLLSKTAEILMSQWAANGLRISGRGVSTKDYLKAMFSGDFDIVLGSKGLDYPDGFSNLAYFKSSASSNYFFMKSPPIDEALDKVHNVVNERERYELYRNIQRSILDEAIIIPLYFGTNQSGMWSGRFKFVPPHPMGLYLLKLEDLELQN